MTSSATTQAHILGPGFLPLTSIFYELKGLVLLNNSHRVTMTRAMVEYLREVSLQAQ